MYRYKVYVTRVVDGDTVDVDVDLGFGMVYKKQRVRMMGIDTPESRTRNLEEKFYGKASKANLIKILDGKEIKLSKKLVEEIKKEIIDKNRKDWWNLNDGKNQYWSYTESWCTWSENEVEGKELKLYESHKYKYALVTFNEEEDYIVRRLKDE